MAELTRVSKIKSPVRGLGPLLCDPPLLERTTGGVLREAARRFGSRPFVSCAGQVVTFIEADRRANCTANAFRSIGVCEGTRVAVLCTNRLEYLDIWFGLARLGAVQVPINTAYKAQQILHTLRRSRVSVLVAQSDLWAECEGLVSEVPSLSHVIALDGPIRVPQQAQLITYEHLLQDGCEEAPTGISVVGTDVGAIMNTSGTTGLAKGVLLQHSQQYWLARNMALALGLGADDVYYNFFPLFHNTAQAMITLPSLLTGAQMVLTEKFSLSNFWPDVRRYGVTVFYFIGEILNLLVKTDPGPLGVGTRLRAGWGIGGAPADVDTFQRRHAVVLGTGYGSTEANVPVFRPLGADPLSASAGKVLPEFEVRIVDSADQPVPLGEVGEIVVLAHEPGTMLVGYDADDEATRQATRGGWFHTGDAGRFDADGNFYFVARLKDVIRVRGENVSASEVETVLLSFPDIVEAAAVAVPGELGGDDVKAVIVQAGTPIDLPCLLAHCEARLPKFSVPRYVEIRRDLPKTATNKIQKNVLREDGLNARTWDSKTGSFLTDASYTRKSGPA